MVVTPIGVDLLLRHIDNSNGHKDIDHTLHMVLVDPLLKTVSAVVMDARASSLSMNSFDINNNEGDK
jgi:hypothetical protein